MTANASEKPLTGRQIEAVELVALDAIPDDAIAAQLKINPVTLHRWKRLPLFQTAVADARAAHAEAVREQGIANKKNRLAAMNDRWQRMQQVIDERAKEMKGVPGGGKTGLLVRTYKSVGFGEYSETVEEYAVDTGLLRELRELEKQGAQEVGDWTEKQAVDQTTMVQFVGIDPERI